MAERSTAEGWEENRRRKLVLGLEATPEQRLDWLEEMIALAHASGALPRRREYVIQLEGTIERRGEREGVPLFEASFVGTKEGELSFVGSWSEGEEPCTMRLQAREGERFVGEMSAGRRTSEHRMHVSAARVRIAPREWELRGSYGGEGGASGELTVRLFEKSFR